MSVHIVMEVREMPFAMVRDRLTELAVDAVVNPATPSLRRGGGVCAELFEAAGSAKLAAACAAIGCCETGGAVVTKGYGLPAKYIIHTVGPVWRGGSEGEKELLASCYRSCLELAFRRGFSDVALPLVSVGGYGFPEELALEVAVGVIRDFLNGHELRVLLSLPDGAPGPARPGDRFRELDGYLELNMGREPDPSGIGFAAGAPEPSAAPRQHGGSAPLGAFAVAGKGRRSLADLLMNMDESFSRMLLRLIDEKGFTDTEVYKRANMDRKHFSKLRKDGYVPGKPTVLALAVALRLNLDETRDFLGRAGYALSHGSRSDLIIEYYISEGVFDIFEINEALFHFGEKPLGF